MGFWRTEAVKHPTQEKWMLQMFEYDYDGELTDVDEPFISKGKDFPSEEAAIEWADMMGITVDVVSRNRAQGLPDR